MRLVHLIFLVLVFVLPTLLHWGSTSYFRSQEIEKAEARLTLYRSTFEAELRHFAHLPFLLSLDPVVAQTLLGGDTDALDNRLARFAQSAGLEAIYLMDSSGLTISASNAKSPSSFKGQTYAYRPYFQAALKGELGEFYGIGATTGVPGYFYGMRVRVPDSDVAGVVAIKINLSRLQDDWQASGERILLANDDGVVLLASEPNWRYKTLATLTPSQRDQIVASRQFNTEQLEPLDWAPEPARNKARIETESLLYLRTSDLPNSWSLHFFVPDDASVTRAWLVTGGYFALVLIGFSTFQLNRLRRMRLALRSSVQGEAALRLANERLAVEIEERCAAEQTLKKTQDELERAGRLAALGQLAASVTHELGQPIAAMRNQLTAAEMTVGRTTLSDKMQGLVDRMENITRQLKFFSRKGRDSLEEFDLGDTVRGALELLQPSINARGADVTFTAVEKNLQIFANKLRIEQVITNVVRNALDAMENTTEKRAIITAGGTKDEVWCEVADTGHGLGDKTLDDLSEPFATTRESGEGMGLGLTISAGIVSDHGGTISAVDRPGGGAMFRISLPRNIVRAT